MSRLGLRATVPSRSVLTSVFMEHLPVPYLPLGTVFSLVTLAFLQAGFRLPLRVITVTTSARLLLVSQASIPPAPKKAYLVSLHFADIAFFFFLINQRLVATLH